MYHIYVSQLPKIWLLDTTTVPTFSPYEYRDWHSLTIGYWWVWENETANIILHPNPTPKSKYRLLIDLIDPGVLSIT